jgi:hypothetical protein
MSIIGRSPLFWEAWREAGFPQPVEYQADRLMLHLDMMPANDADEVELIESEGLGGAAVADDRHPVQELEQ